MFKNDCDQKGVPTGLLEERESLIIRESGEAVDDETERAVGHAIRILNATVAGNSPVRGPPGLYFVTRGFK